MSFLDRLWFRLTSNPEADKAWKEQQAENKVVGEKEISTWEAKLAKVNDPAFAKTALPEDITYLIAFIKDRIKKLKTFTLSSTDIDRLNTSTETQQFNTMMATVEKRHSFKTTCTNGIQMWNSMIKDLQDKKQTVPPAYPKIVTRIEKELPWFAKQKFADGDVYDKELDLLKQDADTILKGTGADLHDPDMSKQAAIDANDKERAEFSASRLFGNVLSTTMKIVLAFLLVVGGVYGSSLATNLNLYHEAPYRVLYAIYGFLFFLLVIPYVLLYRWWWKGLKPRFYSLIPLVPYHFDNYYAGILLSWMSYRPDDRIESLKEWRREQQA